MSLTVDSLALATFLAAVFRYADDATWIAWRAFRDDAKDQPPVLIAWSQVAPTAEMTTIAARHATTAANHPFPTVFCPPIATFQSKRAREADLANGLALSVECDTAPALARATLEQRLGLATVVVASGGMTPNGEPKLHLHWRLAEPTTDAASHAALKRARVLATAIVGGDATNVPAVHPIRWPGSWHRKSEPRLATIVAANVDRELVLSDALEQLEIGAPPQAPYALVGSTGTGETTSALIATVLSGSAIHAPLVALAFRYLKGGMSDAQCVLTLRGVLEAIPEPARGGAARWTGHYNDVPRTVRTAREKIGLDTATPERRPDLSRILASAQSEQRAPAVIVARTPEVRDIPAELLTPPGVLGDVARYGVESAVRPVPIFAVQAALALGSIVCARRYVTSQRNYSSLYFLNVAKSGTGKEHAKTTIENVLLAAGAERLVGSSSYSSGSAVFSALLQKPQHLTIIDEFGKYLEAANNQRENWKTDVLTQLMEAFGRCHGRMLTPQFSTMTVSSKAAADLKPKTITRPAITLLAMTTPSTFYGTIRSTKIQDGFLNRFIIVEHQGPRVPMVEWKDIPVPESAVQWVQQILQGPGNIDPTALLDVVPDATPVDLTEKAFAISSVFEQEMLSLAEQLEPDGLGDMPIRAREIALRLSLIIALSDTPDTPMVTADCLSWSIDYVRFFLEQTIAILRERVADSATERTRNVILAGIRASGALGVTNRELNRGKAFIGVPKRERSDAIESLLAAELVAWIDLPRESAGRPRHALVAVEPILELVG